MYVFADHNRQPLSRFRYVTIVHTPQAINLLGKGRSGVLALVGMSTQKIAVIAKGSEPFPTGVRRNAPRRVAAYHLVVTCLILILGALEGWYKRTDFSTDAISYLDISRAIPLRDWKMIFNPLWSVGYPVLLAVARPFFPPTGAGEWFSIHVVNFAIFVGAWFAFLFLLRSVDPAFLFKEPEDIERRRMFLFLSGACIFVSIQLCIDSVSRVGPDLLVTLLFFLATALVIRLLRAPSYGRAALLGLILGLGYWTKGIFMALAAALLVVATVALFSKKRKVTPIFLSFAIFILMVVPYAAGLSWSFGKFTLGESGPLNYAFHVNLLPRWTNWQGKPDGYGKPIHPTQQISEDPNIFTFGEPYHNTYPPFGNIAYWYQGYRHFWSLKYQAVGIARDLQYLVQALIPQPIFYAVVLSAILMFFAVKDKKIWIGTTAAYWPFYLPAVVGVLLYIQVHLEDRYLGSFFSILCLLPFVTIAQLRDGLSRKTQTLVLVIMAASALLNYALVDKDVLVHMSNHYTYAENPQWKLAVALERAGLNPGDQMAVVGGPNASCTWAYFAHLRIVAELGGEPFDQRHPAPPDAQSPIAKFWHSSQAQQQKIVDIFRQTGAVAVIASEKPPDIAAPVGWRHLEGTNTWMYRLH